MDCDPEVLGGDVEPFGPLGQLDVPLRSLSQRAVVFHVGVLRGPFRESQVRLVVHDEPQRRHLVE